MNYYRAKCNKMVWDSGFEIKTNNEMPLFESILADTKWNILKILSDRKTCPSDLSKELNTTIANISQQLRLLEAYGVVTKERIQGKERNKPRRLYSIAQDSVYYVTIANKFAEKNKICLTKHKKTIFKIWSLEKEDWQYYIEKFYWKIEPRLNKISKIGVDVSQPNITIIIEADLPKEFKKFNKISISKPRAKTMSITVSTMKKLKLKEEVKIIFENVLSKQSHNS